METVKTWLRNPLWLILAVVGGFVALSLLGGLLGYLSQGGLATAFNGLLAAAYAFAVIRLARYLNLTVNKDESDVVARNPVAIALSRTAIYLFAGLLALAVF
jgi:hypothetical protein